MTRRSSPSPWYGMQHDISHGHSNGPYFEPRLFGYPVPNNQHTKHASADQDTWQKPYPQSHLGRESDAHAPSSDPLRHMRRGEIEYTHSSQTSRLQSSHSEDERILAKDVHRDCYSDQDMAHSTSSGTCNINEDEGMGGEGEEMGCQEEASGSGLSLFNGISWPVVVLLIFALLVLPAVLPPLPAPPMELMLLPVFVMGLLLAVAQEPGPRRHQIAAHLEGLAGHAYI